MSYELRGVKLNAVLIGNTKQNFLTLNSCLITLAFQESRLW